jgi:hypothetical protein
MLRLVIVKYVAIHRDERTFSCHGKIIDTARIEPVIMAIHMTARDQRCDDDEDETCFSDDPFLAVFACSLRSIRFPSSVPLTPLCFLCFTAMKQDF